MSVLFINTDSLTNQTLPLYGGVEVDFSDYENIENYIPATGTTWTVSSTVLHKLIPVPSGYTKVSFTLGETSTYCYAFLTATGNTGTIPFSASDAQRHVLSANSGLISIPPDALYVYVLSVSNTIGLPGTMVFSRA